MAFYRYPDQQSAQRLADASTAAATQHNATISFKWLAAAAGLVLGVLGLFVSAGELLADWQFANRQGTVQFGTLPGDDACAIEERGDEFRSQHGLVWYSAVTVELDGQAPVTVRTYVDDQLTDTSGLPADGTPFNCVSGAVDAERGVHRVDVMYRGEIVATGTMRVR
jgi:hypothetical protein